MMIEGMENFRKLLHVPVAKAEMLIRKPVVEVFEAFVNPAVTTRFWFTKSSGRVEADFLKKFSKGTE